MKKGILALLILFSFAAFAEKNHEKTAKLEKNSYCKVPKSHGDYKKINEKDSRVDIDFENCIFDGENYENVKIGILIQDKDKVENYLKKYKGMVMNIMRFLVLIYIIFTIINILQGADSMFLYIQYCSRNCNHILSLMTIIGISRLRHNIK